MNRTGSGHSGKDPTLSVFDRFASVAQELLEDLAAAGPHPRADAIFESALELALEESVIVVGVDHGRNSADHLDGIPALGSAQPGRLQQQLGGGQDHVGELSVDPPASFGPVVRTDKHLARLVEDVLAAQLFAVQVNRIVPAERIEQDVHVVLAAELFHARARRHRRRFDDTAPQSDQGVVRDMYLHPTPTKPMTLTLPIITTTPTNSPGA